MGIVLNITASVEDMKFYIFVYFIFNIPTYTMQLHILVHKVHYMGLLIRSMMMMMVHMVK